MVFYLSKRANVLSEVAVSLQMRTFFRCNGTTTDINHPAVNDAWLLLKQDCKQLTQWLSEFFKQNWKKKNIHHTHSSIGRYRSGHPAASKPQISPKQWQEQKRCTRWLLHVSSLKQHLNCFLPVRVTGPQGRVHHYPWQLKVCLWLQDLAHSPSFSEPAGVWTPFRHRISLGPTELIVCTAETVLLAYVLLSGPDELPFLLLVLKITNIYLSVF